MTQPLEDLELIGHDPGPQDFVRVEPSPRWVRAYFSGRPIADSKRTLLVFEPRRLPVYYFPTADVQMDLLRPGDVSAEGRMRWTLESDGRAVADAAWTFPEPDQKHALLRDHIAFSWDKVDQWLEEDEEVFVHPRDPHKRVDVMASSRHVRVVLEGEMLAESRRPHLLFETGLPTRYYLPRADVRLDLLVKSATTTQCPYKGRAEYWSVRVGATVHADLVWSYPFPIPECPKIAQLLAFFNEKVDLYVDGVLQPRPKTNWS